MRSSFNVRALEIHEKVWDRDHIIKALQFMKDNNLNTLILHSNDIVDQIVWPAAYYGAKGELSFYEQYNSIYDNVYRYNTRRRYMPIHRCDYINWVVKKAGENNIDVYLENKEIWFDPYIEEVHPGIRKNSKLCCSEPFWQEYLTTKYRELSKNVKGLAGVITSIGSRESMLSASSNRCECDMCRKMDKAKWHFDILMSIYTPLKEAGLTLVVRDFALDRTAQSTISNAMSRMPDDVILCYKNTPHDFYPTFPDNPKINGSIGQEFWVEFDAMGQYFGWGIGIACLTTDIKRRFIHALDNGACGVIVRTDWEGLPSHSVFDTPNLLSLYAFAMYADDINTPLDKIYLTWLKGQNMIDDQLSNENDCIDYMKQIFEQTWHITSKAIYSDDCVSNDSSAFPISIAHFVWLYEVKNNHSEWNEEKGKLLEPLYKNLQSIFDEKDYAKEKVKKLKEFVFSKNIGLKSEAYEDLKRRLEWFELYVEGFCLIVKSAVCARVILHDNLSDVQKESARDTLNILLKDLENYSNTIDNYCTLNQVPFEVYALLNKDRVLIFLNDVKQQVKLKL